jgi:hypothetical protein
LEKPDMSISMPLICQAQNKDMAPQALDTGMDMADGATPPQHRESVPRQSSNS